MHARHVSALCSCDAVDRAPKMAALDLMSVHLCSCQWLSLSRTLEPRFNCTVSATTMCRRSPFQFERRSYLARRKANAGRYEGSSKHYLATGIPLRAGTINDRQLIILQSERNLRKRKNPGNTNNKSSSYQSVFLMPEICHIDFCTIC